MKIEKRTEKLSAIREMNKVPGVLFGKSITPVSIQVDENELQDTYLTHGKTQTFTAKLGKESHQVYIKQIQMDIINRTHILNVELLKVDKDDTITAKVPLHIIGKDEIEKEGYIVQVIDDSVEVEYNAGKGVSHIDVDITGMKVHDMVHIKDVKFPKGIKNVDSPERMLIHIVEQRIEKEVVEDENEVVEAPVVVEEPKAKSKTENKK
jgi:large subunit ribosomal protein L25